MAPEQTIYPCVLHTSAHIEPPPRCLLSPVETLPPLEALPDHPRPQAALRPDFPTGVAAASLQRVPEAWGGRARERGRKWEGGGRRSGRGREAGQGRNSIFVKPCSRHLTSQFLNYSIAWGNKRGSGSERLSLSLAKGLRPSWASPAACDAEMALVPKGCHWAYTSCILCVDQHRPKAMAAVTLSADHGPHFGAGLPTHTI